MVLYRGFQTFSSLLSSVLVLIFSPVNMISIFVYETLRIVRKRNDRGEKSIREEEHNFIIEL